MGGSRISVASLRAAPRPGHESAGRAGIDAAPEARRGAETFRLTLTDAVNGKSYAAISAATTIVVQKSQSGL